MMSSFVLADLPGLLAVALLLGLRHGFDADHLAAIDAMARFNAAGRPRLARRTGLWFSLGHGAVVLAVALGVAALARDWRAPGWLAPFGAWTSIAVLVVLGLVNLAAGWRAADDALVAVVGWRTACFARAMKVAGAAPILGVGALFAMSFDTLGQAALMAATGTAAQGVPTVVALVAAFVLGMLVTDGLNGLWVARLLQRSDATAARASRVMCLGVAAVSLGTAALGAATRLSPALAGWAAANAGMFGLVVVGVVLASFLVGARLAWRPRPAGAARPSGSSDGDACVEDNDAGSPTGEIVVASIEKDVATYEAWLRRQCDVVEADLDAKHRRMRKSGFDFLRATYFRWARTIEALCPGLVSAPKALCIGDIHVENYGTWRDADARLVWGINDFDEATVMPYAFDLVRLTTSAILAPDVRLSLAEVSAAVLRGYRRGLKAPRAELLDEDTGWLRAYANPSAGSNRDFWQEVDGYPDAKPPAAVRRALKDALPAGARLVRHASRSKGGGGLGRPRYLVIAAWNSGPVIREAKALVPSAWLWAHDAKERSRLPDVASGTFRSPDPSLHLTAGFVLRRIAPDARKIELAELRANGLTEHLLAAMAADLAAVHAASGKAARIAGDLDGRPAGWLQQAAGSAQAATEGDFARYRQSTA